MKKKLAGIIAVFVVIIVVANLYYSKIYKLSVENLVKQDTQLLYINDNLKSKNYSQYREDVVKIVEKLTKKDIDIEELKKSEKYLKYIKSIFGTVEIGAGLAVTPNVCIGVDVGYLYYFGLLKIEDYFYRDGEFYIPKDEIIKSDLPYKIYMKPYKGVFLFSNSKEMLAKVVGTESYPLETQEKEELKNSKNLGKFIFLNSNELIRGIKCVAVNLELAKEIIVTSKIVPDDVYQGYLKENLDNRKLDKKLQDGQVYIALKNPKEFIEKLQEDGIVNRNFVMLIEGLNGVKFEDLLLELTGEAILDYTREVVVLALKEEHKNWEKIDRKGKMIEENIFYFPKKIELKDGEIKVPKDTFVFGGFETEKYYKNLKIEFLGKNRTIEMKFIIDKESFEKGMMN